MRRSLSRCQGDVVPWLPLLALFDAASIRTKIQWTRWIRKKNATTIEAVPENLWSPSHQTDNPAWSTTSHNYNNSSRYVYNSSYAKLKNLSISYHLPVQILSKINVKSLEIYLSGQNLWTITPYKGYDPEIDNAGNAITQGQEFGVIPNPKTYTFGLRLGL